VGRRTERRAGRSLEDAVVRAGVLRAKAQTQISEADGHIQSLPCGASELAQTISHFPSKLKGRPRSAQLRPIISPNQLEIETGGQRSTAARSADSRPCSHAAAPLHLLFTFGAALVGLALTLRTVFLA